MLTVEPCPTQRSVACTPRLSGPRPLQQLRVAGELDAVHLKEPGELRQALAHLAVASILGG